MSGPQQARVLLAMLTECTSGRGNAYLRGWAGASNLVGSVATTTSRAAQPGTCTWWSASPAKARRRQPKAHRRPIALRRGR